MVRVARERASTGIIELVSQRETNLFTTPGILQFSVRKRCQRIRDEHCYASSGLINDNFISSEANEGMFTEIHAKRNTLSGEVSKNVAEYRSEDNFVGPSSK